MSIKVCATGIHNLPATGRSFLVGAGPISVQRLPTDPLFSAAITLQNITIGSRYWIARASDLSQVLASGLAEATEVTLSNIPAYANPMLMKVVIRKPGLLEFVTYANLVRTGVLVYVLQTEDGVYHV